MSGLSAIDFPGKHRIHIALAVKDLQASRQFYETLLGEAPTKVRPGYVKFEPLDPSVNLTLNEVENTNLNRTAETHFGVQVKSAEIVEEAVRRFAEAGLETAIEQNSTCCYAVQDKVWVTDPDGNRWEVFVVLQADANQRKNDDSSCCADRSEQPSTNSCC